MKLRDIKLSVSVAYILMGTICAYSNENWLQYKYDSRHSGDVPETGYSTNTIHGIRETYPKGV
jgi:hypothetical protein